MSPTPSDGSSGSFVPPPYPYDRLDEIAEVARAHEGGIVDLSIGTPCDPPSAKVIEALAASGAERGYPPGTGTAELRRAASDWMGRRFGIDVPTSDIAACVGTKEFVGSLGWYLRLRDPSRDTILHPKVAYPTYDMSAQLAGIRAVGIPERPQGGLDFDAIDEADAKRALVLWVNSPANPSGSLTDLAEAARWGRERAIPVASDECYTEFTWSGPAQTILTSGSEGVLAVHSLSKRSNLAGCRVGFYAGDPELVYYLAELRRHAGLMVPGPIQHAGAVALDDDEHVAIQREIYRERLESLAKVLESLGLEVALPDGAFYLWIPSPQWAVDQATESDPPSWVFARALAEAGGLLVAPGDLYGEKTSEHVRIAVVQPDDRMNLVARRLASSEHLNLRRI